MPTPAPVLRATLLLAAPLLVSFLAACTSLTEPSENVVIKEQRPVKAAAAPTAPAPAKPPTPATAQPQPRPLGPGPVGTTNPAASASVRAPGSAAPKASGAPKMLPPRPTDTAPRFAPSAP